MVEIKNTAMKIRQEDFENLLNHLKEKFSSRLALPVKLEYSGEFSSPMSSMPYYSLAVPRRKKIGPFEYGKQDRLLLIIYPSIYGRSRGTRDMFCSLFCEKLEQIAIDELQRYGDIFDVDTVYLTEIFI
jgi:hypothetical protein